METLLEVERMKLEKEGRVAWLTFTREAALNAMDNDATFEINRMALALLEALHECFDTRPIQVFNDNRAAQAEFAQILGCGLQTGHSLVALRGHRRRRACRGDTHSGATARRRGHEHGQRDQQSHTNHRQPWSQVAVVGPAPARLCLIGRIHRALV